MAARDAVEGPPGGYDEEMFVKQPVDSHWKCAICLEVMRDPVEVSGECGHLFCRGCITAHIETAQRLGRPACCPEDNVVLPNDGQIRPSAAFRRMLLKEDVRCLKNANGGEERCAWTGELRNIDGHHENECLFCEAPCTQGCDRNIVRRLMDQHKTDDCTQTPRPCEFHEAGCREVLRAAEMEQHIKDEVARHMTLLMAQNREQNVVMQEQARKIATLEAQSQQQSTAMHTEAGKIDTLETQSRQHSTDMRTEAGKIDTMVETVAVLQRRMGYSFNEVAAAEAKLELNNTKLSISVEMMDPTRFSLLKELMMLKLPPGPNKRDTMRRLTRFPHFTELSMFGVLVPNQQLSLLRTDCKDQQCIVSIVFESGVGEQATIATMDFKDLKSTNRFGVTLRNKRLVSFCTGGREVPDDIAGWPTMPTTVKFKFFFPDSGWYTFQIAQ